MMRLMSRTGRRAVLAMVPMAVLLGCGSSRAPTQPTDGLTFTFDFDRGPQGFVAGFADYPPDAAERFALTSGHRPLPTPLASRSALFLSGINRSADLFMFFKGPVDGLRPEHSYTVSVGLEIATDTPAGCAGIGGAPGESVWIKAGASAIEPLAVSDGGYARMNVDVGTQSNGGAQARVLGNLANSRDCEQPFAWELKSLQGGPATPITVPADGRAWLLFGADSGFEDLTQVYFTQVSVTFEPA